MNGNVVVAWDARRDTQQVLLDNRALLGRDVAAICALDPLPFRGTLRPLRGGMDELVLRQQELLAAQALEAWALRLRAEGVDVDTLVDRGERGAVFLREARARASAAIAIVARPPPAVFGATMARLVRDADVPVLLLRAPRGGVARPERVVALLELPADGARGATPAIELASIHDAELILVVAGDPLDASVRATIDDVEERTTRAGVTARIRLAGRTPLRRLIALLDEGAPEVISAAAGPVVFRLLLGSPSSVLVAPVRGPAASRRFHSTRRARAPDSRVAE